MSFEISATMRKHQLKLADRQCRMSELSLRCQDLITILCASLYGARQDLRDCLFIAISQSGRSPDLIATVESAREAGALTVAVPGPA